MARNFPREEGQVSLPSRNRFISDGRLKGSRSGSERGSARQLDRHLGWREPGGVSIAGRHRRAARLGRVAYGRLLASVEIEAQMRSNDREMGYYGGTLPPLTQLRPAELHVGAVSLNILLTDYTGELQRSSRGAEAACRWKIVYRESHQFLEARRRAARVAAGRSQLARPIADDTDAQDRSGRSHERPESSNGGIDSSWLKENVAHRVKVHMLAKTQIRECSLTDDEAKDVLKAALSYRRIEHKNARTSESVFTASAKRWVPWICAFTDARVAEIAYLRKSDVRLDNNIHHIRITPDTGP